jgi:hypothetical protein
MAPVGSFPYGIVNVASSATPVFDCSQGCTFKMTLTSNATVTIINPDAGHMYTFLLYQDANGLHSVTWPANLKGGISIPITSLANSVAAQTVIYDGTNFVGDSLGQMNL